MTQQQTDLWSLPPEEPAKPLKERWAEASAPKPIKPIDNDNLSIQINGLQPGASAEQWYVALKWHEYIIGGHDAKFQYIRELLAHFVELGKKQEARINELEQRLAALEGTN